MNSSLSSPQQQVLARRRQQLYGPGRCAGLQAIQSLQRQDHIKQSFRRGVNPAPSRETYQSITARDYKVSFSLPPSLSLSLSLSLCLSLRVDYICTCTCSKRLLNMIFKLIRVMT